MADGNADVSRRNFLRAAAAGTAVAGATGTAAAAEDGGGGGEPDLGGWVDPSSNFDGVVDATGQDSVTITVGAEGNNGNFAFGPPAVHVDNGATVVWEWNGEGGEHNVVAQEGADFESELTAEQGFTFEQTFEEDGIVKYYCNPHRSLGMVGAVVVGTDYPTVGGGGGGASTPIDPKHMGVPFQAHFVGLATLLAIAMSLIFVLFQLKYGESPNTKGGND